MSDTTKTETELNTEAGLASASMGFGAADAASAETAEILNLLGSQESGASCCGGSCCA